MTTQNMFFQRFFIFRKNIDFWTYYYRSHPLETTVGYVFPMVIWSEFYMRQYRLDDHREDAPHFKMICQKYKQKLLKSGLIIFSETIRPRKSHYYQLSRYLKLI